MKARDFTRTVVSWTCHFHLITPHCNLKKLDGLWLFQFSSSLSQPHPPADTTLLLGSLWRAILDILSYFHEKRSFFLAPVSVSSGFCIFPPGLQLTWNYPYLPPPLLICSPQQWPSAKYFPTYQFIFYMYQLNVHIKFDPPKWQVLKCTHILMVSILIAIRGTRTWKCLFWEKRSRFPPDNSEWQ